MSESLNTNTHAVAGKRRLATMSLLAALALGLACKSDSSVVSNSETPAGNAGSAAPQIAASPEGTGSSVAGVPPSATPTAPSGPSGQATPVTQKPGEPTPGGQAQDGKQAGTQSGQPGGPSNLVNEGAITRTAAKPAPTLEDPFPPRPTPTIVMQNGKIVQQWAAAADAAGMTNPHKNDPNAVALGRTFYMQKCVDCHGKSGQGNGWMSPSLKREGKPLPPTNLASRMVQANTDGELFWKITNGRSPMPAHRVRFDDNQRWYIVAFLRTLK